MWPFSRSVAPAETLPDKRSPTKRLDDLELELLELRETQEKTMAAIKRIQGRLLKRVQVAEGEMAAEDQPEAPNGVPEVPRVDRKAALRQRANQLRAMR